MTQRGLSNYRGDGGGVLVEFGIDDDIVDPILRLILYSYSSK